MTQANRMGPNSPPPPPPPKKKKKTKQKTYKEKKM